MGLCGGETAKKKKPKTIIIPKGVVDPKKDNVLEIPPHLVDANSNLIVKATKGPSSVLFVEPYLNQTSSPTDEEISATAGNTMTAMTDPFVLDPQDIQSASNMPPAASSSPKGVNFSTQTDFSWGTQQIVVQTTQPQPNQNFSSPGTQQKQNFSFSTQQNQITCPICSQTSCKYIRPYSNLLNQLTPKYSRVNQDFDDGKTFGPMKPVRSEIIFRPERAPKQIDETALLNKLLDEKVDKILKPILHSLARGLPVDEEREITTRTSYGSLEYRYSKERYPRRSFSPRSTPDDYVRSKSSSSRTRRCPEFDYDDDSTYLKTSSPDSYGSKRKNVVLDESFDSNAKSFQKCPSPNLCYKRANVNFEPTTKTSDFKGVP